MTNSSDKLFITVEKISTWSWNNAISAWRLNFYKNYDKLIRFGIKK